MKVLVAFTTIAITAGVHAVAVAQSFTSTGTDFSPAGVDGKIVTNAHDDTTGLDTADVRVSQYTFQVDPNDPNFTQDPGFNAPTGSGLVAGSVFSFDVLDSLKYWDGVGPVRLGPPANSESLVFSFGPVSARTLTGSSGPQSGFNLGSVTGTQTIHKHLNAFLEDSTGSYDATAHPTAGIYVTQLRVNDTGLTSSDPIFALYNNGLSTAQADRARFYVRNNFAPGSALLQVSTSMVGLSALPGEANLATGGQVTVTRTGGTYHSEIDELTTNANKGSVVINQLSPVAPVLAMVWLNGSPADMSSLISNLSVPDGYSIVPANVASTDPLYSDVRSLQGEYAGFAALIEFSPNASNGAFTWDFSANPNVTLDRFAAISKTLASVSSRWTTGAGGAWATATSWSAGIPSSAGDTATFASGPGITSPCTVLLTDDRTVGHVVFASTTNYTIGAGGGKLTLADPNGAADITVTAGSHTILAPVTISNGLVVDTSAGGLTLADITGTGPLTKTGAGLATLSKANNFTGGITVNGGTVAFAAPGALPIFTSLKLAAGANIIVAAHTGVGFNTLLVDGLTLSGTNDNWTSQVDLANNDMVVRGGDLTTTINQVRQGFNAAGGGGWTGSGGITSSTAQANSLTALGTVLNSVTGVAGGAPLYGSGTALGLFDGQSPAATDVLVRYTYFGDANLDGRVDGSDYTRIDNGFNSHLTGWFNGDFNYDGVVDGSDYTLIDNAFNTQGESLNTADLKVSATAQFAATAQPSTTAVPEPVAVLPAIVALSVLQRRRCLRAVT